MIHYHFGHFATAHRDIFPIGLAHHMRICRFPHIPVKSRIDIFLNPSAFLPASGGVAVYSFDDQGIVADVGIALRTGVLHERWNPVLVRNHQRQIDAVAWTPENGPHHRSERILIRGYPLEDNRR